MLQDVRFALRSLAKSPTFTLAAGVPRKLGGDGGSEIPESYSADGKLLVLSQESFETGFDLWILELEDLTRRPFLTTLFDERSARLSPDGRFVAYSSNESGKYEIYATSFPEPGARLPVSVAGGEHPRSTRGGKEILFLSSEGMMAVEIRPRAVSKRASREGSSPIGRRFLSSRERTSAPTTSLPRANDSSWSKEGTTPPPIDFTWS